MHKYLKLLIPAALALATAAVLCPSYFRWAREHVNNITATTDHPMKCGSCHLYLQKEGIISKIVNTEYYSPLNVAVSADGKFLFVVAEESNELLIVDRKRRKVTQEIEVGIRPHSVTLSLDGRTAYVSNQWSDNVSVIDLASGLVRDNLKTANGPAGIALSPDGQTLFAVNSYSSDISVIDLETGTERKRLTAGNDPTGLQANPDGSMLFTQAAVLCQNRLMIQSGVN